jgi:hypothetical protein
MFKDMFGKEIAIELGMIVVGFEASAGALAAVANAPGREEVVVMPLAVVNNVKSIIAFLDPAGGKIILKPFSSVSKYREDCDKGMKEASTEIPDSY